MPPSFRSFCFTDHFSFQSLQLKRVLTIFSGGGDKIGYIVLLLGIKFKVSVHPQTLADDSPPFPQWHEGQHSFRRFPYGEDHNFGVE